jgi:hypothetical protein
MKRNDLLTNEQFFAKRITQKFARSENRIKYHNRKATKLRHSISYIQSPLYQNLKILNRLMRDEEQKQFHKEFIKGSGINLNFCTHFLPVQGKNYPCLYNYMIKTLGEEMILIKKLKLEK